MEKGSSHSSSSAAVGGPHSLNGLNFGKKIYFEDVGSGFQAKTGGAPPSPAKKGQSGQPPRCQVEGCRVDLSDTKAYYSRHKVCGMHSKYPKVIVAGLEQRFCQQCSRFHQLPEFDQGKRSCRRRLAGHNERRRKPPLLPPPRYRNLCPSMFGHNSNAEGFVMDFANPWQRYNTTQNALSDLVQGTTPKPGYPDSTSALSLLSNQPWAPKTRPPSGFWGATTASFGCSSWAEMPPDLGLGQSSHPNNTHYTGLAPQPNEEQFHGLDQPRAYDSPVQNMHWLL